MKYDSPPPIWVLDYNQFDNARYQTDKLLAAGMSKLYYILLSSYLRAKGLKRKKRVLLLLDEKSNDFDNNFNFYFKDFPTLPFFKVKSLNPGNEYVKFTSKCLFNFNFMVKMFEAYILEYERRNNKETKYLEILEFFKCFPPTIPSINITKIILPYKKIPVKYRTSDIITGLRYWYIKRLKDIHLDYAKTDIPEWVIEKTNII